MDLSRFVNVFTGTTNGGHTFPGVTAGPFAPVKLGPDFAYGTADAYAGYLPDADAVVTGFSMLHESGIGGAPKYGVVSQMPTLGDVPNPLVEISSKRARGDEGSVGHFKSTLQNGIVVELAATAHAGYYQYDFPENEIGSVVVDVSHVLPSFRGFGWGQKYHGGSFRTDNDGHYEGSGVYSNGWNLSPEWTIYFCGKFDQTPLSSKTFVGQQNIITEYGQDSTVASPDRLGGVFTFDDQRVTSRVGVSWTSVARACEYLNDEIPDGTTLTTLIDNAKKTWNEEVFSKVTTTDTDHDNLALLYTSLYGMHLLPSNRTGDNPKWQSAEPYYDDIFTFWDLFRCTTSLFHVLQPVAYEELLRSIVDTWRHEGWLPDARSSNFNGRTHGGSNADNVLADAYVKGVRGQVNWEDAYAAMQKDAEVVPPNNNDPIAPDSSTAQGRGALSDWHQLGYISPNFTRAVTRAVEYAGNDFGLSQVASGVGKSADAAKYMARARQWRNHWNPAAQSLGTSGFLVPRRADGTFVEQDPLQCGGCYWGDAYYQGKSWEYTVNAHHDVVKLIELDGGNDAFVQRLNTLMDPANKIFNPGNQPSITTPYLYNFAGRQDLSVQQSRRVAKTFYNAGPGGIPGAADAGSMQSWILWNMIGLYPVTGQTTFLIGSPWFSNLVIKTPSGRDLRITTNGGSESSFYVQNLRVNGESWNKNWVTWNDIFANGGDLAFVLGPEPVRWDIGDLPPSPASLERGGGESPEPEHAQPLNRAVTAGGAENSEQGMATNLMVAIIVSSIVGCLLVVAAFCAFLWYRKRVSRLSMMWTPPKVEDDVQETAPSAGVVKLPQPACGTAA